MLQLRNPKQNPKLWRFKKNPPKDAVAIIKQVEKYASPYEDK